MTEEKHPQGAEDARAQAKLDMAELYSRVRAEPRGARTPRFAFAGRRLVDLTHVAAGDAVLDIGCGRGAVRRVLRPRGVIGFAFERDSDPRWSWAEDHLRARG